MGDFMITDKIIDQFINKIRMQNYCWKQKNVIKSIKPHTEIQVNNTEQNHFFKNQLQEL